MKPEDVPWHDYLRGYAWLRWRKPEDEQQYHELMGLLQPLYALRGGDLLDSVGPRQVIVERTQEAARRQGHTPFCFRLQCLVTGRVSRIIPYERFIEFGILSADATTGGPFPLGRQPVTDRISPVLEKLQTRLDDVRPCWDDSMIGEPWSQRYDEYLHSPQWLSLRERVLRRDKYRCTVTGKAREPGDPLQVHHLTYDRIGCESLDDLVTICRSQHKQIHAQRREAAGKE